MRKSRYSKMLQIERDKKKKTQIREIPRKRIEEDSIKQEQTGVEDNLLTTILSFFGSIF